MRKSLALMCVPVLLIAGCSRPVVKETVIERPVVVSPAPAPAAAGGTTASCIHLAQTYTHGARSCQEKSEWVCNNGAWTRTNNPCS
jgi:hypothetical protein